MVKVDIRDQGDGNLFFNFLDGNRRILIRNRDTDNFTPGFFQILYLGNGGRYVLGVGIGHGLHGDRGEITHRHHSDRNAAGFFSLYFKWLCGHVRSA